MMWFLVVVKTACSKYFPSLKHIRPKCRSVLIFLKINLLSHQWLALQIGLFGSYVKKWVLAWRFLKWSLVIRCCGGRKKQSVVLTTKVKYLQFPFRLRVLIPKCWQMQHVTMLKEALRSLISIWVALPRKYVMSWRVRLYCKMNCSLERFLIPLLKQLIFR